MVNGDVVRKGSFDSVSLSDGDRVELIVIASGG
jgi:thiamine biosynthesis protein ThiS